MAWLQRYQSHTWNIFPGVCFMAGSTVFASVHCSVGWIRLFCKMVFLFFHNMTFTWYPLKKDHHPTGYIFPSVCSIVLVGALLPKSVCSLCPRWAAPRLSKKGQDINYTAHKREAGHTESVSGFNSVGNGRFKKIWGVLEIVLEVTVLP